MTQKTNISEELKKLKLLLEKKAAENPKDVEGLKKLESRIAELEKLSSVDNSDKEKVALVERVKRSLSEYNFGEGAVVER